MAEAFGIASGVAGVVSLGLTVCGGVKKYLDAIKDRDEDIKYASQCSHLLTQLRGHIDLFDTNARTLSSHYARSADLVVTALQLCEGELQDFEAIINTLKPGNGSAWSKTKSAATYPFNQSKLKQVQDRLYRATTILGTVANDLVRHDVASLRDDVAAIKNALQGESDDHLRIEEALRRLSTKVEDIRASVAPAAPMLTEVLTEVREQRTMTSRNNQEISASIASATPILTEVLTEVRDHRAMTSRNHQEILLRMTRKCQTIEPARNDTPLYLKNASDEKKYMQAFAGKDCLCPDRPRTAQQSVQKYGFWGGVTLSRRRRIRWTEDHQHGCPMYIESSSNGTTSTKTTVTYAGRCYLLSWALDISFNRGPVLAQFLRMSNVRETSPAFEVFNWGECPKSYYTTDFHKLKAKLQKIYKLPNVSPRDVDEFGQNAAHLCVVRFGCLLDKSADFKEATQLLDNLQKILWFLGTVGVDIYAGENHDGSMLEYLMVEGWTSLLPRVYDVLKSRDSEFDPGFDQRPVWDRWDERAMDRRRHLRIFRDAFHDRPDILEDTGYGELFLAISRRDESGLKDLIDSARFTELIGEKDFFRHNALHLCINWRIGLELLLQKKTTHYLVNEPDSSGSTPLHYALAHSGSICHSMDVDCDCSCCVTAKMLLKTDCRVVIDFHCDVALEDSSPGAGKLLLQHLKYRRERLRDMAMKYFSETELQDLGVAENELPDATAAKICDRLQSLDQKGVIPKLHDGINPRTDEEPHPDAESIFHSLSDPRYAEIAFDIGFQSIDAPDEKGITPVLYSVLHHAHPLGAYEEHLVYANWLIEKGANLDYSINSLRLSAAHNLAQIAGWRVRLGYRENPTGEIREEIANVLLAVSRSAAQSHLQCPCTTEELSLPLHHFFVASLADLGHRGSDTWRPWGGRYFSTYHKAIGLAEYLVDTLGSINDDLENDSLDTTYLAKSIIHVLTMGALGIKHLPRCHSCAHSSEENVQARKQTEEWDELLDEQQLLIKKLADLTKEFEQAFSHAGLSIEDFLYDHWLPKMRRVRRKGALLTMQERETIAEIGVVLEQASEDHSYHDSCDSEDYEDDNSEDEDFGGDDSHGDDSSLEKA